jgi:hypothetical protein
VLEVDERPIGPQALAQLVPRDDVAATLEHHAKDLEWLILQTDSRGARPQLARTDVELERTELESRCTGENLHYSRPSRIGAGNTGETSINARSSSV